MVIFPKKINTFILAIILSATFIIPHMAHAAKFERGFTDTLPEEERAMKDTVDHWGLPFSDQLRRFIKARTNQQQALGNKAPKNFIVGIQHSLEKVPLNKYWFKGQYTTEANLSAAKNEYESFQLAILPDIGKSLKNVAITAQPLKSLNGKSSIPLENITIYRVGYVNTNPARYPSLYTGMWPDILLPNKPIEISGTNLGLFWVEIKIPENTAAGKYQGKVTITTEEESLQINVSLNVYNFALPDRVPFPLTVWTTTRLPKKKKLETEEMREIFGELLKHSIDPLSSGKEYVSLKKNDFKTLDENLEYCIERGLQFFEIPRSPKNFPLLKEYIKHIKEKGWLDKALAYLGPDEPDEDMFLNENIKLFNDFNALYPDIRVFLASEYHDGIDKGCDIWLNDLSTGYGPEYASQHRGNADMWFYFCHLPVRIDYTRPLVQAPNMQIDNEAIEHRIALWMCWKYQAKGMFIYSGNSEWRRNANSADWQEQGWNLNPDLYRFPYAGIHNGNGYLIYPGPTPSVRMKILRDGMEDMGYFMRLKELSSNIKDKQLKEKTEELLKIPQNVLVNAHYFNRDPKELLKTRNEIAAIIEDCEK